MDFEGKSGKYLDEAILQFSGLPGIGKKTALRFALHLLKQPEHDVEVFATAILKLKKDTRFCTICHNICDDSICPICNDHSRDHTTICVVEGIHDVLAIEATSQYNGVYHVLGGVIAPMEGIGPSDLNIDTLTQRASENTCHEVILALPATVEGDTTNFYIHKKIAHLDVKITAIARGIAIGNELQYIDEITLGQSIINRKIFNS